MSWMPLTNGKLALATSELPGVLLLFGFNTGRQGVQEARGSYEEEPRTPSAVTPAVPKLTAGSRLSSLDSGATSESDETYKAPPSACAVSSPPRTQVAASQGQASSKLNAPAVVRYERDELLDLCTQAIAHGNYREYDLLVKHFPDMMPKVAGE
uniref:Uncharacterized protein n=2 Tax=Timema TaxID=61471 RepID=A0A7R9IKQ9_9NEOP|nr:unnamed protein product [Timema bartmani]CAD7460175.1 unnamed protein product [Timema tahoe]